MLRPLFKTAMIKTPTKVPHIRPRPPLMLVPPNATEAMASSSNPSPRVGCAEESLDNRIIPDSAAMHPDIAYAASLVRPVFTPASLAEVALLPVE